MPARPYDPSSSLREESTPRPGRTSGLLLFLGALRGDGRGQVVEGLVLLGGEQPLDLQDDLEPAVGEELLGGLAVGLGFLGAALDVDLALRGVGVDRVELGGLV